MDRADREWLEPDKEDLDFIGGLGDFKTESVDMDDELGFDMAPPAPPKTAEILKALSIVAITEGPDAFCDFVAANKEDIYYAALFDDDITRALLVGYKMGINQKNGACANDLGAMYYSGDLVEQDYQRAADLYEMAIEWGCDQSIINMGYIYEYGRLGKPDYAKAYEYYALGCALTNKSEALYKLGDMYSRGNSVQKDMSMAAQLWAKSLSVARSPQEIAQPSIRLAPLYLEGSEDACIEKDAMLALHLYQQAEIGLRIDIQDGYVYYSKRLPQAIEGQEKARRALDEAVLDEGAEVADEVFRRSNDKFVAKGASEIGFGKPSFD